MDAVLQSLAWWQILILALVFAWAIQVYGTMRQMRHYREVMGEISARYSDGFLGAGNARSRLGRGVIVVIVADRGGRIVRALVMEGRSVFAKFQPCDDLVGRSLEDLGPEPFGKSAGRNQAVARAVEQIVRARARDEEGQAEAQAAPPQLAATPV